MVVGPEVTMIWLFMCLWKNGHISRKPSFKKRIFIFITYWLFRKQPFWWNLFSIGFNIFGTVFSSHMSFKFSDRLLFVVCPSVCYFFIFSSSTHVPIYMLFSSKLGIKHPWVKEDSSLFKWKVMPFLRCLFWDNNDIKRKYLDEIFKFVFSWTTGPFLTQLGTRYPWLRGFKSV